MRRLRNQEEMLFNIKRELIENEGQTLRSKIQDFKKARLVEEKMSYEDLIMKETFNAEERTYSME